MTMSRALAHQLVARKLITYVVDEYDIGLMATSFESGRIEDDEGNSHSIPAADIEEIKRLVKGIVGCLDPDDADVEAAVALLEEVPPPHPVSSVYPSSTLNPFITMEDGRVMRWLHSDTPLGG